MERHDLAAVLSHFPLYGDFGGAEPYGSGHINATYHVTFFQAGRSVHYLLQKINTSIFRDADALMENIARVLTAAREAASGAPEPSRQVMTLIPARDGRRYYRDDEGGCWRVYLFIENTLSFDVLETPEEAYEGAKAFGTFQKLLAGLAGPRLHETIKDFHHTVKRFAALEEAIRVNAAGRASGCAEEIAFARRHERLAHALLDPFESGLIPERITHNDTKLNNVLFDAASRQALCVIDLDTVMPGLSLYDFGDLVRTSVSPAAEDERDLTKVSCRMAMFEALARGFLTGCGELLNAKEIELLPIAGAVITFETGIRFLTDHLSGDTYFRIHRTNHNLDRCRTQFRLMEVLLDAQPELAVIVKNQTSLLKKSDKIEK